MQIKNPFEYEEAKKLTNEEIVSFFIEDHNYSRMLLSSKNVFLRGERGSGKTMALLFNSFDIQYLKAKGDNEDISLDKIGIYVPCNTPIQHKEEHLLLDEYKSSLFLEHLLVLDIGCQFCEILAKITSEIVVNSNEQSIKEELEYILDLELSPNQTNPFRALKLYLSKELNYTQKNIINSDKNEVFYNNSFSFSSLIVPIIDITKKIPELASTHFAFMIDDAQLLKEKAVRALNSWIAFRDHSKFSFKVATTKVDRPTLFTSFGGTILDGHDFIELDMEFYYDNSGTYNKISRDIVEKRLSLININVSCEEFFPIHPSMVKDLGKAREETKVEYIKDNPTPDSEKMSVYVSRYHRVKYFRSRTAKSNLPPYSGFETLVHLSTGVIRNLLEPMYSMYDDMLSKSNGVVVKQIDPNTQFNVINNRSTALWEMMQNGLEKSIEKCSYDDSKRIHSLFERLGKLFQYRLQNSKSEPRALMFTITGYNEYYKELLEPLFNIARQGRLLYVRMGNAKLDSKREPYYVPNKMLWPIKGLDPIGQHARVSLKAKDIWDAANGKDFPITEIEQNQINIFQNTSNDE